MTELCCDVCVLGAGPAGAALARRLALLGHSVVVVEKTRFPRPQVGESIAPSVLPLLDVLGLRHEVEDAGFLRPPGMVVFWKDDRPEYRVAPADPGFQVARNRFDIILLDGARALGAIILQPAKVISRERGTDGHWQVDVLTESVEFRVRARKLADASGRSCATGGKRKICAPASLALCGSWRGLPLRGLETRIEAGPHEWYWGTPLAGGEFIAMAFLEQSRYKKGISEYGSLTGFYRHLLGRSCLLRDCLEGQLARGPRVHDASCYTHRNPVEAELIRCGEAALTIDPMSSQGVVTAMGLGIHAAVVLHTMLDRPDDTAVAARFYEARIQSATLLHADATREFCRQASLRWPTAFWRARAAGGADVPIKSPTPRMPGWDDMVRVAPEVTVVPTAAVANGFVIETSGLLLPGRRVPVVYLEGVPVTSLLRRLEPTEPLSVLIDKWKETVSGDIAMKILTWAVHNGFIVTCP